MRSYSLPLLLGVRGHHKSLPALFCLVWPYGHGGFAATDVSIPMAGRETDGGPATAHGAGSAIARWPRGWK